MPVRMTRTLRRSLRPSTRDIDREEESAGCGGGERSSIPGDEFATRGSEFARECLRLVAYEDGAVFETVLRNDGREPCDRIRR